MGAQPVVIYRRSQQEMPAFKDEVGKAIEEGIKFKFLTLPTKAAKTGSMVTLTCVRMKLGSPDASGRRRPVPKPGSHFTLTFNAVIKAIGEEPDTSYLPTGLKYKAPKGSSSVYQLDKHLFAGGDFVTGPSTVVQAVAAGREAADIIGLSLSNGQPSAPEERIKPDFIAPSLHLAPRIQIPVLPAPERIRNIVAEDTPGPSADETQTEAQRCFNCGCICVNPSDISTALVALNAIIVTTKRTIDAASFFISSDTAATILASDEMVTEICIPKLPDGTRQNYLKFTLRNAVDFAIVSVASVITAKKGICSDARIVLGAVAPTPVRAEAAEGMIIGRPIDENIALEAAKQAVVEARPLSMNAYKIEIAKVLVKKAILGLPLD